MQTYVMPVLVYGLEIVLPKQKHLDTLERFNRKFLKLILSLPVNVADPAVYILTGMLPVEAVLHKRVLKSRKENPQKLTQLSSGSHPRHLVGKKDSTKRHHHRHHKRQPGEQQFPKQVVTG